MVGPHQPAVPHSEECPEPPARRTPGELDFFYEFLEALDAGQVLKFRLPMTAGREFRRPKSSYVGGERWLAERVSLIQTLLRLPPLQPIELPLKSELDLRFRTVARPLPVLDLVAPLQLKRVDISRRSL